MPSRDVWRAVARFRRPSGLDKLGVRANNHKQPNRSDAVRPRNYSRRDLLKASSGLLAGAVFAQSAKAAAPPPVAVTTALIDAARREPKVSFYTALELTTSERLAKAFEAKYPGIAVRVERSGAERNFQRIAQEQGSGIRAVDVVCSTDPAHFIDWERNDWVAPFVPEDVAKHFPPEHIDPDGIHAVLCAWLEAIGYNTNLVARADAPGSNADLLDAKWRGKLVKAHPRRRDPHHDVSPGASRTTSP